MVIQNTRIFDNSHFWSKTVITYQKFTLAYNEQQIILHSSVTPISMNYKSPDSNLTVPDSISQEELIKYWAISQLTPERKETIIDVLKEFREQRERKEGGDLTS